MKNRVMMVALVALMAASMMFTGCYSVFSGGTGGRVVDAESTDSPKRGIADVDVYAYVDKRACQKDFDNWEEGTKFKPEAKYYAHTSSGSDGSFTISKLMWKSMMPDYWRDGDVATVYLLYYHDEYGLVMGDSTLLLSDSTTNTVYQELKAVKKSTVVNFSVKDVATNVATGKTLQLTVNVPQGEAADAAVTEYSVTAANGTGAVKVTYPRYKADGTTEFTPTISVTFVESASEISFKMCKNGGTTGSDYGFDGTAQTATISGERYDMALYGKRCIMNVPVVSGQYKAAGNETDDGKVVSMDVNGVDCGFVTTHSEAVGTSGTEKHGVFNGLGSGYTWTDDTYQGKLAEASVTVTPEGGTAKTFTVKSNETSRTVQLQ